MLLADEEAGRAAVVPINHGAGGRAVDAELVLNRMGAHVVARAQRAIGIDQEFGHQEERDAARARRSVWQARQHKMDDIVGEVVLAVSDEDLLPGDPVGAIGGAFGFGAQRADVGARLRLGELHGAHPFAGDELGEIGALERFAAVFAERLDARHGQQRSKPESHVGRVPHFDAGCIDGLRQILPAPRGRTRNRIPAACDPILISLAPARRRRDAAIAEQRAMAIADDIEGGEHIAGKSPGFAQNCIEQVVRQVAIEVAALRLAEARRMSERKGDIGDGRDIGHAGALRMAETHAAITNLAREVRRSTKAGRGPSAFGPRRCLNPPACVAGH